MVDLNIGKFWKKMASTVNPNFTITSKNQYMQNYGDQMWIERPKIQIEFKDYKKASVNMLKDQHSLTKFLT